VSPLKIVDMLTLSKIPPPQFNTFVDTGVLLNNYAHVFDLLIRLRQAVNHPYMVVHSATTASAAQGGDV
jgi:SNF2 family DNA or RNA helicase